MSSAQSPSSVSSDPVPSPHPSEDSTSDNDRVNTAPLSPAVDTDEDKKSGEDKSQKARKRKLSTEKEIVNTPNFERGAEAKPSQVVTSDPLKHVNSCSVTKNKLQPDSTDLAVKGDASSLNTTTEAAGNQTPKPGNQLEDSSKANPSGNVQSSMIIGKYCRCVS